MKCPTCGKNMKVTHTIRVGDQAAVHRRECKCGVVVTSQTTVVNINPGFGQGAAAIAKKLKAALKT